MDRRFLGARLDGEMVFLDRETGQLIRLEQDAAAVWESCAEASAPRDRGTHTTSIRRPSSGDPEKVLVELERAGMVIRVEDRRVRPAVEWT